MANVKFVRGTREQFDLIQPKDENTLYWLSDEQAIYKGDQLFGTGKAATRSLAGLLSADDKKKLEELVKGTVHELQAVDGSIVLSDIEGGKSLKVGISLKENNSVKLESDGLYVQPIPVYELEKKEEGAEDYAAVYRLKCTLGSEVTYSNVEINIPKDLVIKGGKLATVESPDTPYEGAQVGDPYLDIELSDAKATHIYIPVKGIIDTSKFVLTNVDGANGKAQIFNEGDGGGAKYTRTENNLVSYVGVHDGEAVKGVAGIAAQIYATVDGVGTRLNVFEDKITYINKTANSLDISPAYDSADYELVVRKDINDTKKELEDRINTVIEWVDMDAVPAAKVDETLNTVASEYATYADISVADGQIQATVKPKQGNVDINKAFGLQLMQKIINTHLFRSIYVKNHKDASIDLTDIIAAGLTVSRFVTATGLHANKLKDLDKQTLDIIFVDIDGDENEYKMTFTFDNTLPEAAPIGTGESLGSLNKNVSALIDNDVKIEADGSVVGTLKYVEGWSEFSGDPNEQNGHYFPLRLNEPYSSKEMTCIGKHTKSATDSDWVLFVADAQSTFQFKDSDNLIFTLNFKKATLSPKG